MGRPKLDEIDKILRLGRRTWEKLKEVEELYEKAPEGPSASASPGRPPVSYAKQYQKLRDDYMRIKADVSLLIKDSNDAKKIDHFIRQTEDPSINSNVGRPKALEVQEIEYKMRLKQARIDRIKSGLESGAGKLTKSGKLLGRAPKSEGEKVSRLEDQILAMGAHVRALESKMEAGELEDLAIRRMRRIAANLRESLREKGLDDLRVEAHKNWAAAKADRVRFTVEVLETCALEREIDERAKKLRESGYTH